MDALGALLREDVDFVNVAGVWLRGRQAVVQDHRQKHQSFRFQRSTWHTDSVRLKYVAPGVAVLHVGWGLQGDFETPTTPRPPHHGIFTWVLCKDSRGWLLVAAQNTGFK